jgi:hypothetical protein
LLRPNFYSLAYYRRWLAFEIVFLSFQKKGPKYIQAGYSAAIFYFLVLSHQQSLKGGHNTVERRHFRKTSAFHRQCPNL